MKNTLSAIKKAHWDVVSSTLEEMLEKNNLIPFWHNIKFKKQDNVGVAPIKSKLHSTSQEKANLINNQFQNVFTQENISDIPTPDGPHYQTLAI